MSSDPAPFDAGARREGDNNSPPDNDEDEGRDEDVPSGSGLAQYEENQENQILPEEDRAATAATTITNTANVNPTSEQSRNDADNNNVDSATSRNFRTERSDAPAAGEMSVSGFNRALQIQQTATTPAASAQESKSAHSSHDYSTESDYSSKKPPPSASGGGGNGSNAQRARANKISLVRPTRSTRPTNKESSSSDSSPGLSKLFSKGMSRRMGRPPSAATANSTISTTSQQQMRSPRSTTRRYVPGDMVLVHSHQYQWANLVNRHGFPPGEGAAPEERQGPHTYVLARVTVVHFEEFTPTYTVSRYDTGAEQRAEANSMEPLRTARGEDAAMRSARRRLSESDQVDATENVQGDGHRNICVHVCYCLAIPFIFLFDCLIIVVQRCLFPLGKYSWNFTRRHATSCLFGRYPYDLRLRLTMVNFVVLCSTWFVFTDCIRFTFKTPKYDVAFAYTNLVVWIVLVLELMLEVFILPEGYRRLVVSEKAYAPATARHISMIHLVIETAMLALFIPEFLCVFASDRSQSCSERTPFSYCNATLMAVTGPTRLDCLYGKAFLALTRLRVFGLVRHWQNMWIANTFMKNKRKKQRGALSNIVPNQVLYQGSSSSSDKSLANNNKILNCVDPALEEKKEKDAALTNASTIGTALMVKNSDRAMAIFWVITGLFPLLYCFVQYYTNSVAQNLTKQLQGTNLIASNNMPSTCDYLNQSVGAWVTGISNRDYYRTSKSFLVALEMSPVRCLFPNYYFHRDMIFCNESNGLCGYWENASKPQFRPGSVKSYQKTTSYIFTNVSSTSNSTRLVNYSVKAYFDQSAAIQSASINSLLLQVILLVGILGGLTVLRRDAEVLVLGPLRRMLKIIAQYAKNPLAQPKLNRIGSGKRRNNSFKFSNSNNNNKDDDHTVKSDSSLDASDDDDEDEDHEGLGSYETEQLITAVTKISDLLRKCWGVAGAKIISTNLATTQDGVLNEVFNPTVPGQNVHALFAFCCINEFDFALRCLGGDVMILINDVAAVLHGEVFRWGLGDCGRCNKNLGEKFLMVFHIGPTKEVMEKLEMAKEVIFNTEFSGKKKQDFAGSGYSVSSSGRTSSSYSVSKIIKRKVQREGSTKAMSLSLASLPGISTFTDRAVIGLLKTFCRIYRDNKILKWNNDLRLGAGVGAFKVEMIYGMDAGWAVEGAVGSEYKIDATYLSPHVNMAARMMSACKQYGVNLMLSQDVEELMSDVARSKLRHLDTVTVKGSSVKQKIYTYDARAKGVDFFLYGRSDQKNDMDAERYTPSFWNHDQDLKAMRQHITEEFLKEFSLGRKAYQNGDWTTAQQKLHRANEIMVETVMEEGYLEDEFDEIERLSGEDAQAAADELKRANGDGPSLCLLNFMKSYSGKAPADWKGWRPLTRK